MKNVKAVKLCMWIILLVVILTFVSCARSKNNYIGTGNLGNGFYNEVYKPFIGGVHAGDITSWYVTDSINFRVYVGSHEDKEYLRVQILSNKISVKKYSLRSADKGAVIESQLLDIDSLKRNHEFE